MKNKLLLFVFAISFVANAQQYTYGIYFPDGDREDKCNTFTKVFKQKPNYVRFGVRLEEDNKLYFEVNNKSWYNALFKEKGDGIAVDIVRRKRYSCDKEVKPSQIRGVLLPPVYEINKPGKLKSVGLNRYSVYIGKVPPNLQKEEIEFNLLFLHNKAFCKYYTIYNLEKYPRGLLDMGVYLDNITYKNKRITSNKNNIVTKYKKLTFSIPFEKDKSEYKPEDIKPLYDSLKLTDYNIKKIDINAYASVEGSTERNFVLQKQRAKSIAGSLQSFQEPSIITRISTSENWVEFFNDIKKTKHKKLVKLPKKNVKAKLINEYAANLEPILRNHRKAVVVLSLEKKDEYKELHVDQLVTLFNKAVRADKLEEACAIQNSILDRLRDKFKPQVLKNMKIPKTKKYLRLLTKNCIFKYFVDLRQTLNVEKELLQLEKLEPNDKRLKYNLAVLKFIIWKHKARKINRDKFKKEILNLKEYGISKELIDKMIVNYHIIKAEEDSRKNNHEGKDKSVKYILKSYQDLVLSDFDYLSIAQFFTYYSSIYDAIHTIEDKVNNITVDEDLLFYYLNLTITKEELTNTEAYRTVMLNAINMNKKRFCGLYNSALNKGVTFQLLEDEFLRATYCENCSK
ncbi:hypothetical protein ACOSP6_10655 [Tenacibaculum sp. MEBiC06402]|uniref:hypothetical protein n=1 Tax=unclassified Tenacibaculum TaxID=2635139 RepID=UPI003B9958DE